MPVGNAKTLSCSGGGARLVIPGVGGPGGVSWAPVVGLGRRRCCNSRGAQSDLPGARSCGLRLGEGECVHGGRGGLSGGSGG